MKLDSIGKLTRTHFSSEVTDELDGQRVILNGWVQDKRDLGGILFIILQDRSGTIQITIPKKQMSKEVLTKSDIVQKRYSVSISGKVQKTKKSLRGVEVIPDEIRVIGIAAAKLPLDITGKTPANIESRLDARSLDLCSQQNIAIFNIQHCGLDSIRDFLFKKGSPKISTFSLFFEFFQSRKGRNFRSLPESKEKIVFLRLYQQLVRPLKFPLTSRDPIDLSTQPNITEK